jgi:hypothetical protein
MLLEHDTDTPNTPLPRGTFEGAFWVLKPVMDDTCKRRTSTKKAQSRGKRRIGLKGRRNPSEYDDAA